jgi:alanine racemase
MLESSSPLTRVEPGSRLTVSLPAIVANYSALRARARSSRVAAVVKADAYGLGAVPILQALRKAGCADFFVADAAEARVLSPYRLGADLYVLNGFQPGAEEMCAALDIIPVINSLEQAGRWAATAERLKRVLPAALQIDSGMSRLGLQPSEIDRLAERSDWFERINLRLIMSHLACADEPAHRANASQRKRFVDLSRRLPEAPLSLANSAGVFLPKPFHFDLVRPGLALYGVGSKPGQKLVPAFRLDASVIQVRSIEPGTGVGYGLSFKAKRPTRVATIALGYADGWPRNLSNCGAAYYNGVKLPFAGRVSMDTVLLDVTDLPDGALGLGDYVELVGDHQTIEEVAADAGTIPYEILAGLGRRLQRTYTQGALSSPAQGCSSQ